MRQSNAEITLMGLPLALTMTVNLSFAAGAVLVPGLWNGVEYLFLGLWDGKLFLNFFA